MSSNSILHSINFSLLEGKSSVEDIIYIGITIAFFLATLGLMRLCEVLGDSRSGEKS